MIDISDVSSTQQSKLKTFLTAQQFQHRIQDPQQFDLPSQMLRLRYLKRKAAFWTT